MSRWFRCLFQLALESDTQIAEEVVHQAQVLAQEPRSDYPTEELEWLSTTAYNRAIDLYSESADAACQRWYALSVNLARLLDDGGSLCHLLEEKFGALNWEN